MDWYEAHTFCEHIEAIEKFLIEIAASEKRLRIRGLGIALLLPSADGGMKAMNTFLEEFSRIRRLASTADRVLATDIQSIDAEGKLTEQISLIALRMRMAQATQRNVTTGVISEIAGIFPLLLSSLRQAPLFGQEPISLDKAIIGLGRLRSLTTVLKDVLQARDSADDEVMKPSNVDKDRVTTLIDDAIAEIENASSLSLTERLRITGYLQDAKREVQSTRPSWSKIVGALVIVAAITTGIADAPSAVKNVRDAIDHILGVSIEKHSLKSLPPPAHSTPPSNVLPIKL